MRRGRRHLERALDEALAHKNIDEAAALLALHRAMSANELEDEPVPAAQFDAIADRLPTGKTGRASTRGLWWRPRVVAPLVAVVGATAILLGLFLTTSDEGTATTERLKGELQPCGPVRLRISSSTPYGSRPLKSRLVSPRHKLSLGAAVSRRCWTSLYSVALAQQSLATIQTASRRATNETEAVRTVHTFSAPGKHVVLAIAATTQPTLDPPLSRTEVFQLLRALADGHEPVVRGARVATDLYELVVK